MIIEKWHENMPLNKIIRIIYNLGKLFTKVVYLFGMCYFLNFGKSFTKVQNQIFDYKICEQPCQRSVEIKS